MKYLWHQEIYMKSWSATAKVGECEYALAFRWMKSCWSKATRSEDTSDGRRLKCEWYLQKSNAWYRKTITHPIRIVGWLWMHCCRWQSCYWYSGDVTSALFLTLFFIAFIHSKRCILWKMLFILHDKRWKGNLLRSINTWSFLPFETTIYFILPIFAKHVKYPPFDTFLLKIHFTNGIEHYINKFFNRNTSKLTANTKIVGSITSAKGCLTNVSRALMHKNLSNSNRPNY